MIMMIFVTTTDALADEKLYEKAYSLIPEYRKVKVDKMKMRENKLQTVTAGLLLNYAVGKWSIKTGEKDYKTVLQEELQKNGDVKIEYIIIGESGPDHNKSFEAEVALNGKVLATGKGKSKKEAEMQAAKKALENQN